MPQKLRAFVEATHGGKVRLGLLVGFAVVAIVAGYSIYSALAQPKNEGEVEGGARRISLTTDAGTVNVFLPADAAAGDGFLVGTVEADPAGSTPTEKERNLGILQGSVVEVERQKVKVSDRIIKLGAISGSATFLTLRLLDRSGRTRGEASPPLLTEQPPRPRNHYLPRLSQNGRPLTVTGPMQDNATSRFSIGNRDANLIAKSPRQSTFSTPTDLVGSTQCQFQEDGQRVNGQINIAKVSLAAQRTNLTRGETSDFTWSSKVL